MRRPTTVQHCAVGEHQPDDVLFINAAEHFEKGKRQNRLTEEHIAKIIATYQFRK